MFSLWYNTIAALFKGEDFGGYVFADKSAKALNNNKKMTVENSVMEEKGACIWDAAIKKGYTGNIPERVQDANVVVSSKAPAPSAAKVEEDKATKTEALPTWLRESGREIGPQRAPCGDSACSETSQITAKANELPTTTKHVISSHTGASHD